MLAIHGAGASRPDDSFKIGQRAAATVFRGRTHEETPGALAPFSKARGDIRPADRQRFRFKLDRTLVVRGLVPIGRQLAAPSEAKLT